MKLIYNKRYDIHDTITQIHSLRCCGYLCVKLDDLLLAYFWQFKPWRIIF